MRSRECRESIVVIGDSQIRALSYSNCFIPFFIGPGAFNNFLTEKRTQSTREKIKDLVVRLNKSHHVMFLISGDVFHHIRNSLDTRSDSNENNNQLLETYAKRYFDTVLEVATSHQSQIMISAVVPNHTPEYVLSATRYNSWISNKCKEHEIEFIDIWEDITVNGFIQPEFLANKNHINFQVAPFYTKKLVEKGFLKPRPDFNYAWNYQYRIKSQQGEYKIWGDFPKEGLLLKDNETYWWNRYHSKSIKMAALCSEIQELMQDYMSQFSKALYRAKISDCHEGFVPFQIGEIPSWHLTAVDEDPVSILMAKEIQPLFEIKSQIQFISQTDYVQGSTKFLEASLDCWICLEREAWSEPARKDLFVDANKCCQQFLFLSRAPDIDRKYLLKAGFENVACPRENGHPPKGRLECLWNRKQVEKDTVQNIRLAA